MTKNQNDIDRITQRTLGIAALRRIRRLVDTDAAEERAQVRWALGIGTGFVVAAVVFVIWLVRRAT